MAATGKSIDFGFQPGQSSLHFAVINDRGNIHVELRYNFEGDNDEAPVREPKAYLDFYRWNRISEAVAHEFNSRLRRAGLRSGRWKAKETLLAPHLGRELVLLIWAVEDADATLIPNMLANWAGLAPEERWWLFTTINASSHHPEYSKTAGWRKAIKIAFAENPVADVSPAAFLSEQLPQEPRPAKGKKQRTGQIQMKLLEVVWDDEEPENAT